MYLSIRHKITLVLFSITFVLSLIVTLFQQVLTYREYERHVRRDAQAAVTLAIQRAQEWFSRNLTAANLLGLETERKADSPEGLETGFRAAVSDLGLGIAFVGMDDGRFIQTGFEPEEPGTDVRKSAWYQKAKEARRTFFIGPKPGKNGGAVILFGAPVLGFNQLYVKGAVAFERPLEELKKEISGIFINEVAGLEVFPSKGGEFLLVVKMKGMPEADWKEFGSRLQTGPPPEGAALRILGNSYLSVYEKIPDTSLTVYYPISLSQLIQPMIRKTLAVIGLSALGLFLIFWFALFFIGRFVGRIQELNETTKSIAAGKFDIRVEKKSNDEIGDLSVSFNQMAESLVNYMKALEASVTARERLNREMELAAEIQRQALPLFLPAVEGLELSAITFPAYEVGGDYYDFIFPEKGKVGFVVADAAGKGFPGTLFMTNSRSVFRVISTDEKAPDQLLTKMNNFIASNSTSGMFITVLYCLYDIHQKSLTCANAGHYTPLIYRPARREFMDVRVSGLPIGILPGQEYETERICLAKDDVVVLFTDGVVEANNRKKEMFEQGRLMKLVEENAFRSAAEISKKIEEAIRDFAEAEQPFDDMTLMVLRVT